MQMFTDGLTNKLVGGWREGAREDTVLVRSSNPKHYIRALYHQWKTYCEYSKVTKIRMLIVDVFSEIELLQSQGVW